MVILALDTTSRGGSCALVRDGRTLVEQTGDAARPQGSRVPGEMADVLDRAGLDLPAVDAFAVAVGPGSFTGLRVGIAAMQGLAFAMNRPLIGVSALDALALIAKAAAPGLPVTAWIDAWRNEVYAADYPLDGEPGAAVVTSPERWLARSTPSPRVFIGDGADKHAALVRAACGTHARFHTPAAPPLAGAVGALAARELAAGRRARPSAITPLYVRRPDVELARETRR